MKADLGRLWQIVGALKTVLQSYLDEKQPLLLDIS